MSSFTKKYLVKNFLFLLVAFLFVATTPALAQNATPASTPQLIINVPSEVYNGQPFLLEVLAPALEQVKISWLDKNLSVTPQPNNTGVMQALALLPVDLDSKKEKKTLKLDITVAGKQIKENINIQILKKKYPEQQLSVDPKFVELSKNDLARHQAERKIVNAIIAKRTPTRHWQLPMLRPVPGAISSLFGVQRMFNGVPRSSHKGLDLRAAEGDPIKACADGTVVLAADHFFSGNAVYIDHGLGVFTVYCHMSKINVSEGDFVKAGDLVGLIGSTGRVTGPHLHLSAIVLSTSVDPDILLVQEARITHTAPPKADKMDKPDNTDTSEKPTPQNTSGAN